MNKYVIIILISSIIAYLLNKFSQVKSIQSYNFKLQEKIFYSTDDIPFNQLKILEYNYKTILSEIPPFDITKVTIKRNPNEWIDNLNLNNFNKIKNCNTWIEGWNDQKDVWFNYPILVNNEVMCNIEKICPKTLKLLQMCRIKINVAGYALLLPHTKLMIHTDPTGVSTNSAAVNLKLNGTDSYLHVKNKNDIFDKYSHQDGKIVIFNSEFKHYASNDGDVNRCILYMDISY
jgi:hypothetical protein